MMQPQHSSSKEHTAMISGYRYLWRSGKIVRSVDATIHVRSVGHASVSAVFEGINAYWSDDLQQLHVFRLSDHMRRLVESTRLAHLTVDYTPDELVSAAVELLRRNDVRRDSHVRPWAFAEGNPTEPMVPLDAACEVVIDSWPFDSGLATGRVQTAAFTSWNRISTNSMPPRIKTFSNYHNGRLGNVDAQGKGADRPLYLDDRQRVTESSGATVGLFKDGVFHTPSLSCGILPGITRATVIELLRTELRVPVVERELERSDFYLADEVVLMGTSAEVLPIVRVDGHRIGDGENGEIGPLTTRLRDEYQAVLRGQRPDRQEWLTPV
jgi:branched-chain amino acid aminotransferase